MNFRRLLSTQPQSYFFLNFQIIGRENIVYILCSKAD